MITLTLSVNPNPNINADSNCNPLILSLNPNSNPNGEVGNGKMGRRNTKHCNSLSDYVKPTKLTVLSLSGVFRNRKGVYFRCTFSKVLKY